MKNLVWVIFAVSLSGCLSVALKAQNGTVVRTVGETNLFRPSVSLLEVVKCVQDETGHYETIKIDQDETVGCYGRWQPVATVQGTQAGALTGLGGAMVQGSAIVGAGYLLADGIRDQKPNHTQVNQSGGNANAGASANPISSSSAGAVATQSQQAHSTSSAVSNPAMGGMD